MSKPVAPERAAADAAGGNSYARGARILTIGIAATGLFTFAFFALASHVLDAGAAGRLDLLWSIMFVIISVIYRPIEQLLSRTIADRRARGLHGHPLRVPATIQFCFAAVFLAVALVLHGRVRDHVFDGSETLYWVLVAAVLAYAASYFARGWLAGHEYFGLYGGLVLMESLSRVAFVLAVVVGVAAGQDAVALGLVAAPLVSLLVLPGAFAGRARESSPGAHPTAAESEAALLGPATESVEQAASDLSLRRGSRFALSVAGIMLAEQTLLNAAVLTVAASTARHVALAGIVFNILLIARAPLQLFQSIQTSLLPHLAGLAATSGSAAFARAIRVTLNAALSFGAVVAVGLLVVGPWAMAHLFGQPYHYGRVGLAVVGLGMGLHLCAGTLNQAALARGQAAQAAWAWLASAAAFVAWLVSPLVADQVLRAELGYCAAVGIVAGALGALYLNGARRAGRETAPA